MITGGNFALECMALSDSPKRWPKWVRKTAYYTIPFSFVVQFFTMFLALIIGYVGAALIGAFWTLPRFLREYYDEELTWEI